MARRHIITVVKVIIMISVMEAFKNRTDPASVNKKKRIITTTIITQNCFGCFVLSISYLNLGIGVNF